MIGDAQKYATLAIMPSLMLDGDQEKWIIKLISEQAGVNAEQISLETRLSHDLGIGSDDASELLELYAEAFSVDLNDFQFHKYFQDEPHLLNFWRWWIPGLRPKLDPITVRNLVEAARLKKLKSDSEQEESSRTET